MSKINKMLAVEVSRGTTHDGPGIRTTIFAKGCPLACRWCQNPESLSVKQEIWYESGKCIGCLDCLQACRSDALSLGAAGIKICRGKCVGCTACADICPAKALTPAGTAWTVDGLVREVLKDKLYYEESGGGVTVSGGEPLIHADFLIKLFAKLRAENINIALDTCGCVAEETLMKSARYIDMILYDIKLIDPEKHTELTGRDNYLILENIKLLASYIRKMQGEKIALWIRTPLIPGATATRENITQIAGFISENILDIIERWELCAFNPACAVKYIKMQKPWHYDGTGVMNQSDIDKLEQAALSLGIPGDKLKVTGLVKQ